MRQIQIKDLFGNENKVEIQEKSDRNIAFGSTMDAEPVSKKSSRKSKADKNVMSEHKVEKTFEFNTDQNTNLIPVPSHFTPRDYQQSTFMDKIRPASAAFGSVMVSMQTGGGKTVLAGLVLRSLYEARTKTGFFFAHRQQLVIQTAKRMRDQLGIPTGIIMAGHKFNKKCRIHSVSIMSVYPPTDDITKPAGSRYKQIARMRPSVIVIDEAHRIAGSSYKKTIRRLYNDALAGTYNGGVPYDPPIVLGLTATPWRLDGKDLYSTTRAMVNGPTPLELSNMGRTVPPFAVYTPTGNLKAALDLLPKNEFGDYQEEALSDLMRSGNRPQEAAAMWMAYRYDQEGRSRPTITFCVTVEHAKSHVEALKEIGVRAKVIYAATKTEDRDKAISELERGDIHVLVNVGIATEGVDVPACAMVHCLRPTNSLSLWIQMAGRGGRPAEGKTHYMLLDQVGNLEKHGRPDAPRIWSLLGWKTPARLSGNAKAVLPNGDEDWRHAPKPPKPPLLIEFPTGKRCVIPPNTAENIVTHMGAFAVLPFSMASEAAPIEHINGITSLYVKETPLAVNEGCPDHYAFAQSYPLMPSMRLEQIVGGTWHYYPPQQMAMATASRLSRGSRRVDTVVRECLRMNPLMTMQDAQELIPILANLARPSGYPVVTAEFLVAEAAKIRGEAHLPHVLALPSRRKDPELGIYVYPQPE